MGRLPRLTAPARTHRFGRFSPGTHCVRGLPTRLAVGALWAIVAVGALSGCFYVEASGGQLDLINQQRPIGDAWAHEKDPERKALLGEVPSILRFARDVMLLRPHGSYRGYYETEAEGLTYVVSAAERTRFESYTWWFPVAGEVAYKSHFEREQAEREAAALEAQGLDVWIAPSRAYSTLGILRDPVVTTMMRDGPIAFVEVLLHELAHARLYVAGHTDFNEQLASFVGEKGTELYFDARRFVGTGAAQAVRDQQQRRARAEALIHDAIDQLEALYARGLPEAEVLRERKPILDALERELAALSPERSPEELRMNNARLMQYRRYGRRAPYLESMWRESGGSFRRFWALADAYAEALAETPPEPVRD